MHWKIGKEAAWPEEGSSLLLSQIQSSVTNNRSVDEREDFLYLHPPEGGSAGNCSCTVMKKSSGKESAPLNSPIAAKLSTISLSKCYQLWS